MAFVFQTIAVYKPLFNNRNGEDNFKRFILPAVRSVPAGLHDCRLIELKLKDKKTILILI